MRNKIKTVFDKGYRVTDDGKVISSTGRERKLDVCSKGYYRFTVRLAGKLVSIWVHELMAYQKYGLLSSSLEVRHLNNDKKDNSWSNIEMGTHTENLLDIPKQIRVSRAKHAASFQQKYNKEEVKEYYNATKSYKRTMLKFGISSKGTLHYILNN